MVILRDHLGIMPVRLLCNLIYFITLTKTNLVLSMMNAFHFIFFFSFSLSSFFFFLIFLYKKNRGGHEGGGTSHRHSPNPSVRMPLMSVKLRQRLSPTTWEQRCILLSLLGTDCLKTHSHQLTNLQQWQQELCAVVGSGATLSRSP